MEVTDDVDAVTADGSLGGCTVTLRLDELNPEDELEVAVNGTVLPRKSGRDSVQGWTRLRPPPAFWMQYPGYPREVTTEGVSVKFGVDCPPLRKGDNSIEVRLLSSKSDGRSTRVLNGLEIAVAYKQ